MDGSGLAIRVALSRRSLHVFSKTLNRLLKCCFFMISSADPHLRRRKTANASCFRFLENPFHPLPTKRVMSNETPREVMWMRTTICVCLAATKRSSTVVVKRSLPLRQVSKLWVGWLNKKINDQIWSACKELCEKGPRFDSSRLGSPKVENVCRQWPPIFDCIAFSCPHAQLGETVGLAAVLRDGETFLHCKKQFSENTFISFHIHIMRFHNNKLSLAVAGSLGFDYTECSVLLTWPLCTLCRMQIIKSRGQSFNGLQCTQLPSIVYKMSWHVLAPLILVCQFI